LCSNEFQYSEQEIVSVQMYEISDFNAIILILNEIIKYVP